MKMPDVEIEDHKFQFRLWHVLYLTALLAVGFSFSWFLFVPTGIWLGVCAIASGHSARVQRIRDLLSMFFLICTLFCCGAGLIVPPLGSGQVPPEYYCSSNVRGLMLAMLNYDSAFGEFPLAKSLGDEGKPPYSWRVAILPFIDQRALYDQYDFEEPWDGPNNIKLLDQMPQVLRCPCLSCETTKTSYKLVTGPGTLFDGGPATYARLGDGSSNTIGLIEDCVDPVEWTRPSDVNIDQAVEILLRRKPSDLPHVRETKFKSFYSTGNLGRLDGSVHSSPRFLASKDEEIRKLFGIDDGLTDILNSPGASSIGVDKIVSWFALGLYALLMLYPLSWVLRKEIPIPSNQIADGAEDA